jgi:hypothetical protein
MFVRVSWDLQTSLGRSVVALKHPVAGDPDCRTARRTTTRMPER